MPQAIAVAAAWITAEIITTFAITSLTAAEIIFVAAELAITVGVYEIGQAIVGSAGRASDPEAMKENVRQAVGPRQRYYGEVKVGGTYAFLDDRRSKLYQLLMLNSGEVDSFVAHYLGDEVCALDGSGNVTSPTRYVDGATRYAKIETKLGTATQTAFATLTTDFPGEWTSAHQLKGITCALITLLSPDAANFSKVYPSGLPQYNAVLHAAKVWDPRDPDQDPDDPTTWTWTQNGVLIVLDYLWHSDGMRLSRSVLEAGIEVWKAQADIADEAVDLKAGGTEPRFRLSGGYDLTAAPKQVLPKMLVPMDARLFMRGDGAVVIDVGRWTAPTVTLRDGPGPEGEAGAIIDYTGLSRGKDSADLRNEITGKFVSPDYLYVQQDADPWQDLDSIDIDGLQSANLDLTWVPSHAQARRRMKVEAYRLNPAWSGQIVTNAYGLRALDQRFVQIVIPELGLDLPFEVQKWEFNPLSGNCNLTVSAMPQGAYDWDAAAEEGTAPNATEATPSTVESPAGLAASATGTSPAATITATWSAPVQPNLTAEAAWRVHNGAISDSAATWHAMTFTTLSANTGATMASGTYDVRVRFIDLIGNIGPYAYVRSITIA